MITAADSADSPETHCSLKPGLREKDALDPPAVNRATRKDTMNMLGPQSPPLSSVTDSDRATASRSLRETNSGDRLSPSLNRYDMV